MRKFQHLAQLSVEELRECMWSVWLKLDELERSLQACHTNMEAKALYMELRHQQKVLRCLSQHAVMRRMFVAL